MEIRNSQAQPQATLSQTIPQVQSEQGGNAGSGQAQSTITAGQDSLSLSDDARQLAQASGQQPIESAKPIANPQQAQNVLGKIVSELGLDPKAAQAVYGNLKSLNFKALLG
jgi:hypothetical protein